MVSKPARTQLTRSCIQDLRKYDALHPAKGSLVNGFANVLRAAASAECCLFLFVEPNNHYKGRHSMEQVAVARGDRRDTLGWD